MSLAAIVSLLSSALLLLQLVAANPALPQSFRDNANAVAQNAIQQATQILATQSTRTPLPSATPTAPQSGASIPVPDPIIQPSIEPAPTSITSSPKPATLASYWDGKAEWRLETKLTNSTQLSLDWPAGYAEGTQIVVGTDGAWYLFHRHVYNATDASAMNSLWG